MDERIGTDNDENINNNLQSKVLTMILLCKYILKKKIWSLSID